MSAFRAERKPIWVPSAESVGRTQLAAFISHCETATGRHFPTSAAFQDFSVQEFRQFWRLILDWSKIPYSGDATTSCRGETIEHAVFFPNVTLNYADVLLTGVPHLDPHAPAIVMCYPDRPPYRLNRADLHRRVACAAMALQELGIGLDSRIAVVARSDADAVVGVLAAAALGAAIATAAPDISDSAMLERLSQVEPVALLCYLSSPFEAIQRQLREHIAALVDGLPSLRFVVLLDDGAPRASLRVPVFRLAELMAGKDAHAFVWRPLPFNHPLFVLFTSGTTGRPKCIVHGAGGTLIEHIKEHRLHCDLGPGDTLFFQTSTAWMMWHWQLSALASGVEIVINAGPMSGPEAIWRIIADEAITVFGTSPTYLQLCEEFGYDPSEHLDFSSLRAVLSTGSILYDRHQDWLTRHVKDLPVQSISGGSDIIGCFVLGNPMVPAYRAECGSRSLGLDVRSFTAEQLGLPSGAGELICANPFPSRPLGFLNDADGVRFHDAYFRKNPGVWTHGDLILFTPQGSARLLGRSDGVMNIKGIRIGPAEIYHAIAEIPELRASLAVEQSADDIPGNARIVLIVVLRDGIRPEQSLFDHIANTIRRRSSPAHVPAIIIDVPDLPMTYTGKLSERSAQDAVNRRPTNTASLRNPGCLAAIAGHPALCRSQQVIADPVVALRQHGTAASLRAIWESVLDRRPIGHHEDFFDLGGDSLAAIYILMRVEQTVAMKLPITSIFEAPTVAAMAALIEAGESPAFAPLVRLKKGDKRPALFIIHGFGGNVMELVGLGRRIRHGGAVYALQARGLSGDGQPNDRVEDMARDYISAIRGVQPHGPYCLAGYSFGGLVAFEMARLLRAEGERIGYLGLLDSTLHERYWPIQVWAHMILHRMRAHLGTLHKMQLNGAFHYGIRRIGWLLRHFMRRFVSDDDSRYAINGLPPALQAVRKGAAKAFAHYRPGFYDGTITLLRSDAPDPVICDPVLNWTGQSRHLKVRSVPGDHVGMVRPPVVDLVAHELSIGLAAATLPISDVYSGAPSKNIRTAGHS
jgi:acetoacetyl-CoA synthetase